MTTITIPASEVKAGDRLTILGIDVVVERDAVAHTADGQVRIDWPKGFFWVLSESPITVTRPDPDAELIEVMAKAIEESADLFREGWVEEARAALTAAREAGLL